ncbi:adenylyl-sulfate kinase [Lentzea roselyniae]|uniref:adenylyl-sulfate kinase n=1 Tax=Lentzea roselyniae TaxID=531940 RepID=UPI003D15BE4B
MIVLVPVIAPYRDSRRAVRRRHERCGVTYLEVHVAAPVEVCAERDGKGLHGRQHACRSGAHRCGRSLRASRATRPADRYRSPGRGGIRCGTSRAVPAVESDTS